MRAKLIIMFALALLVAGLYCPSACAPASCHQQEQAPCPHCAISAGAAVSSAAHPVIPVSWSHATVLLLPAVVMPAHSERLLNDRTPSPPRGAHLATVVLRV